MGSSKKRVERDDHLIESIVDSCNSLVDRLLSISFSIESNCSREMIHLFTL